MSCAEPRPTCPANRETNPNDRLSDWRADVLAVMERAVPDPRGWAGLDDTVDDPERFYWEDSGLVVVSDIEVGLFWNFADQ
ncbi:hypothetical protein OV450_2301 [Actinobacteria bacterium OV450]|nr:hypothetical protein OV450_2301 [Actinobacteria bacterium OV450]